MSATFSDFTAAYEQYDAEGPTEALAMFLSNAESLGDYDPGSRAIAAQAEVHRLIHVADGKHGLWLWHLTMPIEHDGVALYGGCVVQTDPEGPVRASTAEPGVGSDLARVPHNSTFNVRYRENRRTALGQQQMFFTKNSGHRFAI